MMGLFSQAGTTFNRVVKPRGLPSETGDDKPPSDTEPDDTSILFVIHLSAQCLSLILTQNAAMTMRAPLSPP
jgi:hypothetical protein